jgi:tetratricopeptide (TPR) repeat protein
VILSLLRAGRYFIGLLVIVCLTLIRVRASAPAHEPASPTPTAPRSASAHAPEPPADAHGATNAHATPAPAAAHGAAKEPAHAAGHGAPKGEETASTNAAPAKGEILLPEEEPESPKGFEAELDTWLDIAKRERASTNYAAAESLLKSILKRQVKTELYRPVLRELAVLYETKDELAKAQQVLAQYLSRYPSDPAVPEVLLEQGHNYQRMGVPRLAVSKFYAVMSTAINLSSGDPAKAQRIVLRAQHEIANCYFDSAEYESAVDFFRRMLKLPLSVRDEATVRFKLVRSLERLSRTNEVVGEAEQFVRRCPTAPQLPEIRVILASNLKSLGRDAEAVAHVAALLKQDRNQPGLDLEALARWQWRAGNDLGNQLYRQGDYINSLEVYRLLEELGDSPEWKWSIWYQTALVLEKLDQVGRARSTYQRILAERAKAPAGSQQGLDLVADLARWRLESLDWGEHAAAAFRDLARGPVPGPTASAAGTTPAAGSTAGSPPASVKK